MADPVVTITNGVPTTGTGTITTLGQTLTDGANATLGANADAVSLTGSISAKLRAIATAIGQTALDLGSGTGGSRTLRTFIDPGSQNANGQATMANSTPVALASDQSSVPVTPAGNVAHDAVDSGNPIKQGGKAVAGASGLTLVAAADRTDSYHGIDGIQYVRPHCGLEDIVTGNATNTDGTSTSCIASSGAGVKTYLTSVVLCNTSATAITVDIKDGSTTKVSLPLPAGSGCVFNPPVPVPGTAATAWSFDPSAAATTVTCSMVGFKSKV